MGRKGDDTVYRDSQMPVAQARELLQLVTALHESSAHPGMESLFEIFQLELTLSIDIVESPPDWGAGEPTKH
ncbi:hypothetical protein C1X59_05795 [Pseudomonas sp. FW215-R2]|nr:MULTISPECIES: hypothetical protein [unclassified Pseudomonas]PMX03134.1 hypothetical protein C1X59_05795 [Pseudomonas sp. FW215-R2]PMX11900.1 hypothetical protein C1X60_04865 [Pseudomonas sp. FW215-L1]PMX25570.1 hypothetical protein C1X57_03605 [Pseudomonas sp. FW215-E1]PNA32572.1 hypothetical protein C1X58_03085 [Pseudomonas sp. FW215-R4]